MPALLVRICGLGALGGFRGRWEGRVWAFLAGVVEH